MLQNWSLAEKKAGKPQIRQSKKILCAKYAHRNRHSNV